VSADVSREKLASDVPEIPEVAVLLAPKLAGELALPADPVPEPKLLDEDSPVLLLPNVSFESRSISLSAV